MYSLINRSKCELCPHVVSQLVPGSSSDWCISCLRRHHALPPPPKTSSSSVCYLKVASDAVAAVPAPKCSNEEKEHAHLCSFASKATSTTTTTKEGVACPNCCSWHYASLPVDMKSPITYDVDDRSINGLTRLMQTYKQTLWASIVLRCPYVGQFYDSKSMCSQCKTAHFIAPLDSTLQMVTRTRVENQAATLYARELKCPVQQQAQHGFSFSYQPFTKTMEDRFSIVLEEEFVHPEITVTVPTTTKTVDISFASGFPAFVDLCQALKLDVVATSKVISPLTFGRVTLEQLESMMGFPLLSFEPDNNNDASECEYWIVTSIPVGGFGASGIVASYNCIPAEGFQSVVSSLVQLFYDQVVSEQQTILVLPLQRYTTEGRKWIAFDYYSWKECQSDGLWNMLVNENEDRDDDSKHNVTVKKEDLLLRHATLTRCVPLNWTWNLFASEWGYSNVEAQKLELYAKSLCHLGYSVAQPMNESLSIHKMVKEQLLAALVHPDFYPSHFQSEGNWNASRGRSVIINSIQRILSYDALKRVANSTGRRGVAWIAVPDDTLQSLFTYGFTTSNVRVYPRFAGLACSYRSAIILAVVTVPSTGIDLSMGGDVISLTAEQANALVLPLFAITVA